MLDYNLSEYPIMNNYSDINNLMSENIFSFDRKPYELNFFYSSPLFEETERYEEKKYEHYYTCPSSSKENKNDFTGKAKEKIFLIVKSRKSIKSDSKNHKKGRRKIKNIIRNAHNENYEYHSKLKEDNIIQKLKVFFIKSSMNLINKRYENFVLGKGLKKTRFLMKIKSKYAQTIKKESNLEFLQIKIKDLFSSELSEKCTKINKDYNKKQINRIYHKNEAKGVIEILNKSVEELLNDYINGTYKDEGFFIQYDLDNIKEFDEKNENEYANKFIETAKNLAQIFNKKISRRKIIKKVI